MTGPANEATTTTEPERVGRYLLFEAVAQGGMAKVHVARLVGPVGFSRIVAIKRLHPHLALEPDFVSMFLDEARLAARIRHPNVVPILDVVSLPTELFIVLEWVSGESLSALSRAETRAGQRIPEDIAVAVLVGALTGLHAAHEAKSESGAPLRIVHRDVSPQNVMVGEDGLSRVLDFGIAHAAERLSSTRAGEVKGKAAYMSPEQIIGGDIDRRTDVYSCGVMAWELLTGRRLFQAPNDAQTFHLVAAGARERVRDLVPSVSPALDAAVMRAISVAPEARFQSARDFAIALEHAVAPASQRAVAEWVERVAGAEIAARARRVARIEAGDLTLAEPQPPPVSSPRATTVVATAASTEHGEPPQSTPVITSDMTAMRPLREEPAKRPDRLWLALGGSLLGAVLFCAVVLVVLAARGGASEDPKPTFVAQPPPPTVPAPTPAPAPTAAPPPAPSIAVAPSASASAKPVKVSPKPVNPCDPPFTWNGNVKVPKPECF